jgi:MFS family permease
LQNRFAPGRRGASSANSVPSRSQPLNSLERRAIGGLSAIFVFRLLGLFLILPVFALYAAELKGHSLFLVGLALGIYGLTQAMLQIPLGMLSDRLGRKPVIIAGLLVFCLGSIVAALSHSIAGVIVGRALQGAGAISAAVMATVADLTREEQRTKAMLLIGVSVGASFVLALLLGPILDQLIGVRGIFWLTAGLAVVGLAVLLIVVPTPIRGGVHADAEPIPTQFSVVLRDPQLRRFDLGIFILHAVLTAMFVVIPVVLVQKAGLPAPEHWRVYVSAMLLSLLVAFPAIAVGERKRRVRGVMVGAIATLAFSQALLLRSHQSLVPVWIGMLLFFVGFNILEAQLPSLISKAAPVDSKGTAIGIYSTFEFLGAFFGGAVGGKLHGLFGIGGVFAFTLVLLLLWLAVAATMPPLQYVATRLLRVGRQSPPQAKALAQKLRALPGVTEAVVIAEEGVAYLKVDPQRFDERVLPKVGIA